MENKDIPNYEGLYYATIDGKIFSHGKTLKFGRNERKTMAKEKKQSTHNQGYLRVVLSHGRINKGFLVHRLIAMVFLPNPENKPMVNHKDGNKKNNHVSNLEWCTRKENELHAKNHGLKPSGQRNGSSKITDDDAEYIRKNYIKRINSNQLSKKFNISREQIQRIANNKSRII
jgi:hypothetical protein